MTPGRRRGYNEPTAKQVKIEEAIAAAIGSDLLHLKNHPTIGDHNARWYFEGPGVSLIGTTDGVRGANPRVFADGLTLASPVDSWVSKAKYVLGQNRHEGKRRHLATQHDAEGHAERVGDCPGCEAAAREDRNVAFLETSWQAQHLVDASEQIIHRVRQLADDLERELNEYRANPLKERSGWMPGAWLAEHLIGQAVQGLNNLHVAGLVHRATMADAAAQKFLDGTPEAEE